MEPTHRIEDLLGSRSKVAVLRVLRGVRVPLNASQIAQHVRLTRPAVAGVLKEFCDAGIVRSSSAGRANVHTLVRENVYVQRLLEPIFAAEETMAELLESDLREHLGPLAASLVLFGSYARGEQTAASDIDVMLVTHDEASKASVERAVESYGEDFGQRFGATLSVLVYSPAEATTLRERSPALAAEVETDAVVIAGSNPREWSTGGLE